MRETEKKKNLNKLGYEKIVYFIFFPQYKMFARSITKLIIRVTYFHFLFFIQMRSYSHDIEKLQKEVDLLQKQNEQLKQELNIAKDQIIELETNAMEVS